jgi:hypothetical protein
MNYVDVELEHCRRIAFNEHNSLTDSTRFLVVVHIEEIKCEVKLTRYHEQTDAQEIHRWKHLDISMRTLFEQLKFNNDRSKKNKFIFVSTQRSSSSSYNSIELFTDDDDDDDVVYLRNLTFVFRYSSFVLDRCFFQWHRKINHRSLNSFNDKYAKLAEPC